MQQLVYAHRPKLFVELGSFRGGLASYIATLFELVGQEDGVVLSVDIMDKEYYEARRCGTRGSAMGPSRRPVGALNHDKIWRRYVREVIDSSTSPRAVTQVRREVRRAHGTPAARSETGSELPLEPPRSCADVLLFLLVSYVYHFYSFSIYCLSISL